MSTGLASLRTDAPEKLEHYTSPLQGYAFNTYDTQGDIPRFRLMC